MKFQQPVLPMPHQPSLPLDQEWGSLSLLLPMVLLEPLCPPYPGDSSVQSLAGPRQRGSDFSTLP